MICIWEYFTEIFALVDIIFMSIGKFSDFGVNFSSESELTAQPTWRQEGSQTNWPVKQRCSMD